MSFQMNKEMYSVVKKHIFSFQALLSLSSCRKFPYLSFTCLACIIQVPDWQGSTVRYSSGIPTWQVRASMSSLAVTLVRPRIHFVFQQSMQFFIPLIPGYLHQRWQTPCSVHDTAVHFIAFCSPQHCVAELGYTLLIVSKVSRDESSRES